MMKNLHFKDFFWVRFFLVFFVCLSFIEVVIGIRNILFFDSASDGLIKKLYFCIVLIIRNGNPVEGSNACKIV